MSISLENLCACACDNILAEFFLKCEIFQTDVVEKKSKHTYYVWEICSQNCDVYEIMGENMVEPYSAQMTV